MVVLASTVEWSGQTATVVPSVGSDIDIMGMPDSQVSAANQPARIHTVLKIEGMLCHGLLCRGGDPLHQHPQCSHRAAFRQ